MNIVGQDSFFLFQTDLALKLIYFSLSRKQNNNKRQSMTIFFSTSRQYINTCTYPLLAFSQSGWNWWTGSSRPSRRGGPRRSCRHPVQ